MFETRQTGPVLQISDYSLSYGPRDRSIRILENVNLSIAPGEVLGLVGESGSAKSSLAYAIMRDLPGQVAHESGSIFLKGENLLEMSEAELQQRRGSKIALVFQNASTALDPTQSFGAHLVETIRRHRGGTARQAAIRVRELFDLVGLPDPDLMLTKYAHQVSGGEKQRVGLALAFACEPDLILFDEPTSALDATTAAGMLDLFRSIQEKTGVSALFISHDLGVVSEIADRVAVIYGGRIVEEAALPDLFERPMHPYTRALMASLPRPSDTRTGRHLAASVGAPAPRLGPPPACNFAHRCRFHDAEICDAAPVVLKSCGDRRLACVRPEIVAEHSNGSAFAARPPTPDRLMLEARDLTVTIRQGGGIGGLLGRAKRNVHAVNEVSFKLYQGETLGLVGESGCGKSSLARALADLWAFEGGLWLDGAPVTAFDHAYRAAVQIIFQNPDSSLNPRHAVSTILSRPLKLYRRELDQAARHKEVAALLRRVGLPAEYAQRYPHQLSGGEKQRVAIARAIATRPKVIICDEITSGLDAAVQASIIGLLREIQSSAGVSMIFITHDLAILRHIAHRVAVMYLGELVETCSIDALDTAPYHPYTEALLSSTTTVDPIASVRRVRLSGSLPMRTARLAGCCFESRCPRRLGEICAQQRPPVWTPESDHAIACHLAPETLQSVPPVWHYESAKIRQGDTE